MTDTRFTYTAEDFELMFADVGSEEVKKKQLKILKEHDGMVVVLNIPKTVRSAVYNSVKAQLDGHPNAEMKPKIDLLSPEDYHITLFYFQDTGKMFSILQAAKLIELPSLKVRLGGMVRFAKTTKDGKSAIAAQIDAHEIQKFRMLFQEKFEALDVTIDDEHGFTPHMTVAYVPEDIDWLVRLPTLKFQISSFGVWVGDDKKRAYDLNMDSVMQFLPIKVDRMKGGPGSGHYGHAGRPGKRGGSLGGSVAMSIRTGKDAAERQAAASRAGKQTGPKPGTPGQPGPEHIERYTNAKVYVDEKMQGHIMGSKDDLSTYAGAAGAGDDRQEFFIADENSASSAGNVIRGNVKAQLVDDVYSKIPESERQSETNPNGISKDDVNQMVKQWAYDSNDNSPESLAMQQAASKEFGIELSDYQKSAIVETKRQYATDYRGFIDESGNFKGVNNMSEANQRTVMRAMYNNTQTQLAEMGYKPGDTVTVFRGIKISGDDGLYTKLPQGTMNYKDNVMASWSTQWNVARDFTAYASPNILSQEVPIENILSTSRTGFGALIEAEVVVLASPGTQVTVTNVDR